MQSEGPSAAAYASLWAAFDNGWDVTDADGLPIPSPADLQEADYACVLREAPGVVEEIADWTRGRMLMALSHFIGVMEAALDAA